jgi:N-acetylglutamate synthase-like GNAT family acetyltransferase
MGPIHITSLTPCRLEETRQFLRTLIYEEFKMEARLKEMDDLSESYGAATGGFWIAVEESSNRIVGCVGLLDAGSRRGYLKRMYLAPGYRALGLGTRLLSILLAHARAHSLKNIYLATDYCMEGAQHFYQRHGFQRINALPSDLDPYGDPLFYVLNLESDCRQQAA